MSPKKGLGLVRTKHARDPTVLRSGRPTGFAESLSRSYAQDDRGERCGGMRLFMEAASPRRGGVPPPENNR